MDVITTDGLLQARASQKDFNDSGTLQVGCGIPPVVH